MLDGGKSMILTANAGGGSGSLVLLLKIVLGAGLVAAAIYAGYWRRMRWGMRYDLLARTGVNTLFGKDHSRDPYDGPDFNHLK